MRRAWWLLLVPWPALAAPASETHAPRVLLEAPSEVVAGEPFRFSVLVSEEWGPEGPRVPTAGIDRSVLLLLSSTDDAAELPVQLRLEKSDRGHTVATAVLHSPGLHRLRAEGVGGEPAESAPVRVLEEAPEERIFWGDLHAHLHTPGAGHAGVLDLDAYESTLEEALAFAREVSLLDFCAVTPHVQTAGGLGRRRDGRAPWDVITEVVGRRNDPRRFVVFPGFEWQGEAGDHCVLYRGDVPFEAPADFAELARAVEERNGILTAHAVYLPSRFLVQPRALVAVEATRDSQSKHDFGLEALRRGVLPAFLGCGDTHGGAIGATSLTGIRAPQLTRDGILRAIRDRRTWATNGERIVLDVRVDLSGELPAVRVRGAGTAPIDLIEIYRGAEPVAQVRGFTARPEFDFAWEDGDLLTVECLTDALTYHAKVVQVTQNRYDPSRRDLAISSPVPVTLEPRHFDAAHTRAGGSAGTAPGRAMANLREAWSALRSGPGRTLPAEPAPGAGFTGWDGRVISRVGDAAAELEKLAAADPVLAEPAAEARALVDIARAVTTATSLLADLDSLDAGTGSVEADASVFRERARSATAALTVARETGADAEALARSWFAARMAEDLVSAARERAASPPRERAPGIVPGDPGVDVTSFPVPVGPRQLAEWNPTGGHEAGLATEQASRWGFTEPPPLPPDGPRLRLRVIAEGRREGARVAGDPSVPLESAGRGWTATVPMPRLGDPPPLLEFRSPVTVQRVLFEDATGRPARRWGAVTGARLVVEGTIARVVVLAGEDSVDVEIAACVARERPLWSGRVGPGESTLVFEERSLSGAEEIVVRWGFAGWRRGGASVVPGHDAARADGFGALPDGRAALALGEELLAVDPVAGTVERFPYPEGRRHESGREFCVVPTAGDRALVRGASGPGGGWCAELDLADGSWRPVDEGPGSGTVAAHPEGGYAWLTGNLLRRRLPEGGNGPSFPVEATGRLLGFEPGGRPIVSAPGQAVRLACGTGAVVERVPGTALAVEPGGAVLLFAGLGGRHAELSREIFLERALADGSRTGPYRLGLKASPVLDPPVRAAAAPDGTLLILAGSTWWRREPDHDWWGASVERWEPVWAGRIRATAVSSP